MNKREGSRAPLRIGCPTILSLPGCLGSGCLLPQLLQLARPLEATARWVRRARREGGGGRRYECRRKLMRTSRLAVRVSRPGIEEYGL